MRPSWPLLGSFCSSLGPSWCNLVRLLGRLELTEVRSLRIQKSITELRTTLGFCLLGFSGGTSWSPRELAWGPLSGIVRPSSFGCHGTICIHRHCHSHRSHLSSYRYLDIGRLQRRTIRTTHVHILIALQRCPRHPPPPVLFSLHPSFVLPTWYTKTALPVLVWSGFRKPTNYVRRSVCEALSVLCLWSRLEGTGRPFFCSVQKLCLRFG